jgi:hypothetical protein
MAMPMAITPINNQKSCCIIWVPDEKFFVIKIKNTHFVLKSTDFADLQ